MLPLNSPVQVPVGSYQDGQGTCELRLKELALLTPTKRQPRRHLGTAQNHLQGSYGQDRAKLFPAGAGEAAMAANHSMGDLMGTSEAASSVGGGAALAQAAWGCWSSMRALETEETGPQLT